MKRAVLLISHGSRSPKAKHEVIRLACVLKKRSGVPICCAFLEINKPSIVSGIRQCVQKGATEIIILLNFLNSGDHALKDIPRFIEQAKKKFPRISFRMTPPIGQHAHIPNPFLDVLRRVYRY